MSDARAGPEVVTFGCRLNIVESDAMRRNARKAGLRDAIIVNTCAVTGDAARKSRQAVRRALRERPHAPVVVSGCASEISRDAFASLSDRVIVLPNAAKTDARQFTTLARGRPAPVAAVAYEGGEPSRDGRSARTRGFVAVQNGCDHRCTFCVIPFGRGASRSADAETVVAEVRTLVGTGYADVTLTGVDLTAWGRDLSGDLGLGHLVQAVLRGVPKLARLRLSSLDCIEADEPLLEALAHEERLMPYLHLSLQSGDDLILKRMKRRHGRDDALRFCDRVRRARSDIVFGADLIAGFPTETDAMFAGTLALARECAITHLHVFPYSARPGTPAARMPAVDAAIIRERAAALRAEGGRRLAWHLDAQIGRNVEVLVERGAVGRTPDFTPVRVSKTLAPGSLASVRIVGHDGDRLLADGVAASA